MQYKQQNYPINKEKIAKTTQDVADLIDKADVNGLETLNILGVLLHFFIDKMAQACLTEQALEELEVNASLFLTQKVTRVLVERRLQLEEKLP